MCSCILVLDGLLSADPYCIMPRWMYVPGPCTVQAPVQAMIHGMVRSRPSGHESHGQAEWSVSGIWLMTV